VLLGFAAGLRVRARARGRGSAKPSARELPDHAVAWGQQVSLVAASLPAVASVVSGAGWPAILWWAIFALPASVALASLATPPALVLLGRTPASGGGAAAGSSALAGVAVVAAVLALAGSDIRLAVAIALVGGYGAWRGAYAARAGRGGPR
jgi:hypothetical protein